MRGNQKKTGTDFICVEVARLTPFRSNQDIVGKNRIRNVKGVLASTGDDKTLRELLSEVL